MMHYPSSCTYSQIISCCFFWVKFLLQFTEFRFLPLSLQYHKFKIYDAHILQTPYGKSWNIFVNASFNISIHRNSYCEYAFTNPSVNH